jgi:cell division control protein 6
MVLVSPTSTLSVAGESDVIPKAAALAAQEHGDARNAVDILYEAGPLAERAGDETITVEHVDNAQTKAEVNHFRELISGTTPHVKHALRALALLTENTTQDTFRTHKIYETYKRLAQQEGGDVLSEDRIYRLLKEQSFLGIVESNHTGGGLGEGSYLEHRLLGDPQLVTQALTEE